MMIKQSSLLLFFILTISLSYANDWVHVPGGYILHKSCIFEVPNGQVQDVDITTCQYPPKRSPSLQIYAMDVHYAPPAGATQMNASWIVPKEPSEDDGQVVYFWPGFKSTKPEMGLPVLQPVLQYGQRGSNWELQSWFVWGDNGVAITAPAIRVSPGDKIDSYMDYDAAKKIWTVYGKDKDTGKVSNLQIARSRACNCNYQWTMLVLETIMSEGVCSNYPSSTSLTFTNVQVSGMNPQWTTRVQMHDCNQAITQVNKDTVQLSWSAS